VLLENLPGGGIRARSPAKINLYLEVLGRRPDGFHEIDTIIQAITLYDEIEFQEGEAGNGIRLEVADTADALHAAPAGEENLVLRAARLLATRLSGVHPPLTIRLTKRIPIGAGLGGGSSDAAATLLALSDLWGMRLSRGELLGMAAELGSDVPFFILGGTARCRGRGELVTPLNDIFEGYTFHYVLAYPDMQVPTSLIYRELDQLGNSPMNLTAIKSLDTMTQNMVQGGLPSRTLLFNRLEPIACKAFPELEIYKSEFEKEPFVAAHMTGSGSTIYGVTRNRKEAEEIAVRLRDRLRGKIFVAQSERPSSA